MAGEPITGSDAKQYKLTWSHDREVTVGYETYFVGDDPNDVIEQANRVLRVHQEQIAKSRVCYVHLKEIGGRTLQYMRGF